MKGPVDAGTPEGHEPGPKRASSFDVPDLYESPRCTRASHRILRCSLISLVAALALSLWIAWDGARLTVSTYEVMSSAAPAGGVRIVQVSDLHAAEFGPHNAELRARIAEASPDIIAVTGDAISMDTPLPTARRVSEQLGNLADIAPVVYSTGNHEADHPHSSEFLADLESRGVTVLRNESKTVKVRGHEVVIDGINDPRFHTRRTGLSNDGIARENLALLDPVTPQTLTVLLAHRPEAAEAYVDFGPDVVLSGHDHGGQIRLPLIGGLVSPSRGLFPGHTEGVETHGRTHLVVSRGLGNSTLPIRVNNPPELVVLVIEPKR